MPEDIYMLQKMMERASEAEQRKNPYAQRSSSSPSKLTAAEAEQSRKHKEASRRQSTFPALKQAWTPILALSPVFPTEMLEELATWPKVFGEPNTIQTTLTVTPESSRFLAIQHTLKNYQEALRHQNELLKVKEQKRLEILLGPRFSMVQAKAHQLFLSPMTHLKWMSYWMVLTYARKTFHDIKTRESEANAWYRLHPSSAEGVSHILCSHRRLQTLLEHLGQSFTEASPFLCDNFNKFMQALFEPTGLRITLLEALAKAREFVLSAPDMTESLLSACLQMESPHFSLKKITQSLLWQEKVEYQKKLQDYCVAHPDDATWLRAETSLYLSTSPEVTPFFLQLTEEAEQTLGLTLLDYRWAGQPAEELAIRTAFLSCGLTFNEIISWESLGEGSIDWSLLTAQVKLMSPLSPQEAFLREMMEQYCQTRDHDEARWEAIASSLKKTKEDPTSRLGDHLQAYLAHEAQSSWFTFQFNSRLLKLVKTYQALPTLWDMTWLQTLPHFFTHLNTPAIPTPLVSSSENIMITGNYYQDTSYSRFLMQDTVASFLPGDFVHYQQMNLTRAYLTVRDAELLWEFLTRLPNLTHLNVSYQPVGLWEEEKRHPSLKYPLSRGLSRCPRLKELICENTQLTDKVIDLWCTALKRYGTITLWNLRSNTLTDEGMNVLVKALPGLPLLQTLILSNNLISEKGAQALLLLLERGQCSLTQVIWEDEGSPNVAILPSTKSAVAIGLAKNQQRLTEPSPQSAFPLFSPWSLFSSRSRRVVREECSSVATLPDENESDQDDAIAVTLDALMDAVEPEDSSDSEISQQSSLSRLSTRRDPTDSEETKSTDREVMEVMPKGPKPKRFRPKKQLKKMQNVLNKLGSSFYRSVGKPAPEVLDTIVETEKEPGFLAPPPLEPTFSPVAQESSVSLVSWEERQRLALQWEQRFLRLEANKHLFRYWSIFSRHLLHCIETAHVISSGYVEQATGGMATYTGYALMPVSLFLPSGFTEGMVSCVDYYEKTSNAKFLKNVDDFFGTFKHRQESIVSTFSMIFLRTRFRQCSGRALKAHPEKIAIQDACQLLEIIGHLKVVLGERDDFIPQEEILFILNKVFGQEKYSLNLIGQNMEITDHLFALPPHPANEMIQRNVQVMNEELPKMSWEEWTCFVNAFAGEVEVASKGYMIDSTGLFSTHGGKQSMERCSEIIEEANLKHPAKAKTIDTVLEYMTKGASGMHFRSLKPRLTDSLLDSSNPRLELLQIAAKKIEKDNHKMRECEMKARQRRPTHEALLSPFFQEQWRNRIRAEKAKEAIFQCKKRDPNTDKTTKISGSL